MTENEMFLDELPLEQNLFDDVDFEEDDSEVELGEEDNEEEKQSSVIITTKVSNYTVMVAIKRLKCFAGPGTNYSVRKLLKYGQRVKIVEEKNNSGTFKWGRIDSDTPEWIPLNFCEET